MTKKIVKIDPNTKYYTLAKMLEATIDKFPDRPFIGVRGIKQYDWTTYRQFGQKVDRLRTALYGKGVRKGDNIGIISKNSLEWAVCAYSAYGLGAGFVAMYEKQDIVECKFIVRDSEIKVLFVSGKTLYEAVKNWVFEIESLEHIICIGGDENSEAGFEKLISSGSDEIIPIDGSVTSKDTAQIIYTSGTTGLPKGVVLSHENQISSFGAVELNFPLDHRDRLFSILPWAHILGVNGDLNYVVLLGASVGLLESKDKLVDNIREVKPTFVITVPAVLNRIYDVICAKIKSSGSFLDHLFQNGLKAADDRFHNRKLSTKGMLYYRLCNLLILKGIKRKLGGNIKYLFVGGSAMDRKVLEFYYSVGLPVHQGYGLSETAAMVCSTSPGSNRIG
ncbi:MAG: AMP-binding protein, partial [Oligoflexales bacterium]|nr:AMP-binding protein [Oligoflexales bacterium]